MGKRNFLQISLPPHKGKARDILKTIDVYEKDYPNLKTYSKMYPMHASFPPIKAIVRECLRSDLFRNRYQLAAYVFEEPLQVAGEGCTVVGILGSAADHESLFCLDHVSGLIESLHIRRTRR